MHLSRGVAVEQRLQGRLDLVIAFATRARKLVATRRARGSQRGRGASDGHGPASYADAIGTFVYGSTSSIALTSDAGIGSSGRRSLRALDPLDNGGAAQVMRDPTFDRPVSTNVDTGNPSAGPGFVVRNHARVLVAELTDPELRKRPKVNLHFGLEKAAESWRIDDHALLPRGRRGLWVASQKLAEEVRVFDVAVQSPDLFAERAAGAAAIPLQNCCDAELASLIA